MEKVQDQTPQDEVAQAPSAARAVALWWAKQVGAPVFRNTGPTDSPEDRRNGDFAGIMASIIASKDPVHEDQGAAFVEALEKSVEKMLSRTDWVSFGVDYGPDTELYEAAKAAGISSSRFPWKTHTTTTKDYVTAALGYGAPSALIWQAPGWVRPACGLQRYEDVRDGDKVVGYEPRDEVCGLPRFHAGDHGDYQPDAKRCKDCGGTYSQHYGKNRQAHIWEPAR